MLLDYFAMGLLFFVAIALSYGIFIVHGIPYEIAAHRNHPQQQAIHVVVWMSLFTLLTLWPFLWIWAILYREDRGWGFATATGAAVEVPALQTRTEDLTRPIDALSNRGKG